MMLGRATSGLPSSLLSREEACEGCGASGSRSDQCSSTVRFSVVTAQTAGAKSGPPVLHPRPLRAVVTQFRSSAPACDKANFQKSGTRSRQESHDEPKVQRTQSMTGKVAIPTRLTAEGYGGQSGSAYRRSGRFTYRESTRATGPAQAPARTYRDKKRRHKNARRPQRHPWRLQAQHRNDECRLSRYERFPQDRCSGRLKDSTETDPI